LKILIVEDERELVKSMVNYLTGENYVCEVAYSEREANEKIILFDYDCILLDVNLPDGSGLHILARLKAAGKKDGVIIITAKNSLDDRVKGLNMGADDYLSKPFHLAEVNARIAAIIRRKQFGGSSLLTFNEITVDLLAKIVRVNNEEVELTRREFDLLAFLIANRNRVVSKSAIAEHVSGDNAELLDKYDFLYSHIKNLKKKLAEVGANDYIKTVYGLGYRFSA
jgi:DNA-binding response OmpR family regulator